MNLAIRFIWGNASGNHWCQTLVCVLVLSITLGSISEIRAQTTGNSGTVSSPGVVDDRQEALLVESETLDVDSNGQVAVFTGSVKARQGKRRLRANRVEVNYVDRDGTRSPTIIRMYGDVFFSTDTLIVEKADTGVFDVRAQTLKLFGSVELTQDGNRIEGDEVEIDTSSGSSIARSVGEQKRVRGEFVFE